MAHPSENASSSYSPSLIQNTYFNQNYFLKGSVKSLSENVKNFQSNKKINFSTESVKKSTIYDLLFITTIYYLQNVNKHSSEMKNQL